MKKIHVVHIIPRLGFGGAEQVVVELATHVSTEKIKQSVITLWDDQPLVEKIPKNVAHYTLCFGSVSRVWRIIVLRRLLKKIKADVVHTHLFGGDVWGRIAARSLGIPVITTEHNINVSEPWSWNMVKRLMRNFSVVYTAPSQAIAEFMKHAYRISLKKIHVIMHGIELEKFTDISYPAFTGPLQLLIIGRVVEQKGHEVLLEALHRLSDISYRLTIVGDGEEKERLVQYAHELGIDHCVVWKSATTAVVPIYAAADIVIVPSRWEGLGIVVLEALASGRVVIASRTGGIPEMISHNENGILVDPGDSGQLALALKEVLGDRDRALRLAQHGRAWAETYASVEKMACRYESLYLRLVSV